MSRTKHPFYRPSQRPYTPPPSKRLHLMVVVFTEAERRGWVEPHLTGVLMRLMADSRLRVTYVPIHAIHPVSAARNLAVEGYFLPSDADILLMIDNDVAPPNDLADAILGTPQDCDIAILPYWVWLTKELHTMPCFGHWEDGLMIVPDPATLKDGWQEMGAGGTGCIWMRRRVFTSDKLTAPFFKIISDSNRGQVMSEDVYFTAGAHKAGFKIMVNVDYICSHFRTVDLAEVNLGIVRMLNRFTKTLQEKYGEIKGVNVKSLIQELHPELAKAADAMRAENREIK